MSDIQFQNDQSTRGNILSVAARLFSERGFANVSIRDICDIAGVTPPTIYHYYGSKDGLFQDVINSTLSLRDFKYALSEAINEQPDPEKQLAIFIDNYLSHFPRDFFNPGMFFQDTTQLSEFSTKRVDHEFKAIHDLAKRIIQDGIQKGVFSVSDPDMAMTYLMNLLMGFVLSEVHLSQLHPPDEITPFVYEMFLNGISCR